MRLLVYAPKFSNNLQSVISHIPTADQTESAREPALTLHARDMYSKKNVCPVIKTDCVKKRWFATSKVQNFISMINQSMCLICFFKKKHAKFNRCGPVEI